MAAMTEHPQTRLARYLYTALLAERLGISLAHAWQQYGRNAAVGATWIQAAEDFAARIHPVDGGVADPARQWRIVAWLTACG